MARPRRRLYVTGLAAFVVAVVALPSTASAGTGRGGPSRTGGAPERPDPSVQVVMTSANLSWRLSRLPDLTFSRRPAERRATLSRSTTAFAISGSPEWGPR